MPPWPIQIDHTGTDSNLGTWRVGVIGVERDGRIESARLIFTIKDILQVGRTSGSDRCGAGRDRHVIPFRARDAKVRKRESIGFTIVANDDNAFGRRRYRRHLPELAAPSPDHVRIGALSWDRFMDPCLDVNEVQVKGTDTIRRRMTKVEIRSCSTPDSISTTRDKVCHTFFTTIVKKSYLVRGTFFSLFRNDLYPELLPIHQLISRDLEGVAVHICLRHPVQHEAIERLTVRIEQRLITIG